jgi:hypothetical protein
VSLAYRVRTRLKQAIVSYGPDSHRLGLVAALPRLRTWQADHVGPTVPLFDNRFELYGHLQTVIGDGPVDYLEFGVYRGESILRWAEIQHHPASRFLGFDSFEGLPEDWRYFGGIHARETFSTEGDQPEVDDPRVRFVKGLFQDTLPAFLADFTPGGQVVVHCDADLYSSTLYVLSECHRILGPGSIVIFDEFASGQRNGKISQQEAALGAEQLSRYEAAGLPRRHVFTENGIIFRRHDDPNLESAMALWWL